MTMADLKKLAKGIAALTCADRAALQVLIGDIDDNKRRRRA